MRDDVGSRVVALDAAAAEDDATAAATASVSTRAPAPQDVSEPTPLPEDKPAAKPVASKPAEAKPAKPAVESKPAAVAEPVVATPSEPAAAGVGFAVQLGAFSKAADANALRDRARAAGLSAFVEQVNTDKGSLSRVQVGPVVDRPAAERLKAQVAAKLGINGFVHSHP